MKIKLWYLDMMKYPTDTVYVLIDHNYVPVKSKYDPVYELDMGGKVGGVSERIASVVCEELFRQFNIGDHAGLRVRSMSVGDVVEIDDQLFMCAGAGWREVQWRR